MTKEFEIAKRVFSELGRPVEVLTVAEFGAWDGIHKSNIRGFQQRSCKKCVFIEADSSKFKLLEKNYMAQPNVVLMNRFVSCSSPNSLDELLSEAGVESLDFLSIDIDGNDYHVFKSIQSILPDLLCIEFNPTIPVNRVYHQPNAFDLGRGSSLLALINLGAEKGYSVLACTRANVIMIKSHLYSPNLEKFLQEYPIPDIDPVELYVGFDGSIFSNKESLYLNWHKVSVNLSGVSPVPFVFRQIPESMSPIKKFFFFAWVVWKRPTLLRWRNIRRYIQSHFGN